MSTEPTDRDDEPRDASSGKPGGAGAWLFGAWIGALVALLVVFAFLVGRDDGRNHPSKKSTQQAAQKPGGTAKGAPAAPAGPGKAAFVSTCGGCHTLSAAGTTGTTGPNLGQLKPNVTLVESAIKNGGAGSGAMPKNLVAGAKATEIAQYVAKAAAGSQ